MTAPLIRPPRRYTDGYVMGWGLPLTEEHVDYATAYLRAELDPNEVVVFMQDLYESGQLMGMPYQFYEAVMHLAQNGLIYTQGRALQ